MRVTSAEKDKGRNFNFAARYPVAKKTARAFPLVPACATLLEGAVLDVGGAGSYMWR